MPYKPPTYAALVRAGKGPSMPARRGKTAERGYGSPWRRLRAWFLSENPLCVDCSSHGIVTAATEVDHIKPLSRGGTNATSNLQALCKTCHSRKTGREKGSAR